MIRPLRRIGLCFFISLWLPLSAHALEPQKCASRISDLKQLLADQTFALKWEETTMDDGKPLIVTIAEKNGSLSVEFVKTAKGLWAEISGEICQTDKDLEIKFTGEQIHFGSAASWVLRYMLNNGGKFTLTRLSATQMRVATTGWSGVFAAAGS